jgi:hypothetical protein
MPIPEARQMDVLQNIEFSIVRVYQTQRQISDYTVMRTLEALIDRYTAEKIGRPPRDFKLSDEERVLFGTVRSVCDWRLGREGAPAGMFELKGRAPAPKTVDDILACLKRILKSAQRWNKDGGREGYLDFISQFMA